MVNVYILINIERVSKHSVTILEQRVVIPAGLELWLNRTSTSKWVGLGSPLAACSMYGDLTGSVHIVNNFHCFVIIKRMYVFVSEHHMWDWHSCQICYPLEIKLLLTDVWRWIKPGKKQTRRRKIAPHQSKKISNDQELMQSGPSHPSKPVWKTI